MDDELLDGSAFAGSGSSNGPNSAIISSKKDALYRCTFFGDARLGEFRRLGERFLEEFLEERFLIDCFLVLCNRWLGDLVMCFK